MSKHPIPTSPTGLNVPLKLPADLASELEAIVFPFTHGWENGHSEMLAGAAVQRLLLGPISPANPKLLGTLTRVQFEDGTQVYNALDGASDHTAWLIDGTLLHAAFDLEAHTITRIDAWLVPSRFEAHRRGYQVMTS